MKIKCLKSDLINGINIVNRAIPNKTTMNILENILITVEGNCIKLTASDMELGIETIIDGTILEGGNIALESKLFSEIIRKLPESDILIETDSNYLTSITCENSEFNISGKSGEEFPPLPDYEKTNPLVISQLSLRDVITKTIFSISDNESNKTMTGELFEINNNNFKVVSLDGHRVSIRNVDLKDVYENKKVIVPGKTLNEITKIIASDANKDVNIYFNEKNIIFEFDNTIVISRLIEGEYFKIDQMFSNNCDVKVTLNKKEFLDCIDRATIYIKDGEKKPVKLNFANDNLEVSISSQIGSMNADIEIEKEGKDLEIGFNPKFLIDALKAIDDENITVYMINSKAPCFIQNETKSYVYLILPVNYN